MPISPVLGRGPPVPEAAGGVDFAGIRAQTNYFWVMLAASIPNIAPWWQKLAFNWFDLVLVVVLAFGLWRGRKRGMSREVLPTLKWLVLVLAAGLGCEAFAGLLTKSGISSGLLTFAKNFLDSAATERGVAFTFSYLIISLVVVTIFAGIQRAYKAKLEGSNAFGSGEYYLGMGAGILRYACILIFSMALLNGPYYSQAEIAAKSAYDKKEFGGGLYNGSYFPHFYEIQEAVFIKSLTGPTLRNNLMIMLVNTGAGDTKTAVKH